MALVQIVESDKAEGQAKEIYDTMLKNAGVIPAPLQLASASPWMLDMVWQSIQYYSRHPNLGFGLLSSIRYLIVSVLLCRNPNFNWEHIMARDDQLTRQWVIFQQLMPCAPCAMRD